MNPYEKSKEPCNCPCHKKGGMVMHMMPCCNLTYEHYINEDDTVDMPLWTELNDKSFFEIMEARAKRDQERAELLRKQEE